MYADECLALEFKRKYAKVRFPDTDHHGLTFLSATKIPPSFFFLSSSSLTSFHPPLFSSFCKYSSPREKSLSFVLVKEEGEIRAFAPPRILLDFSPSVSLSGASSHPLFSPSCLPSKSDFFVCQGLLSFFWGGWERFPSSSSPPKE